jgi:hypothetical protein
MCVKHWYTLPETLREDIRKDTDKGAHSLRAQPSREWLAAGGCVEVRGNVKKSFHQV